MPKHKTSKLTPATRRGDEAECIAVWEYQMGKPARLITILRDLGGKPLSPFLGSFLVSHFEGELPKKRGAPEGARYPYREATAAHLMDRYMTKHGLPYLEAMGKATDDMRAHVDALEPTATASNAKRRKDSVSDSTTERAYKKRRRTK